MSGPIPVKCLFCRSIYRRGLATRRPGLFFYFIFFVIVLSVPCRLSSRPLLIFLPLSCCQGLAACRPGLFRSFLHCCHVCVSLPSLLYYSRRCSVLVRLPCVIFAVSAPPWCPTCIGSRGSWYYADWAFDRQVCTIRAFLGSDSGAASRRLGKDTVDSLSNVC